MSRRPSLAGWRAPPRPARDRVLEGRWCTLEPLVASRHAAALHEANAHDTEGRMWEFLSEGPYATEADYRRWAERAQGSEDPHFLAIRVRDAANAPLGVAAWLRIEPAHGVIEIGHLAFSPRLQRTRAATEAVALMLRHAFALGYRRCEWKCDERNERSRSAALRLGFTFEGVFRQHRVVKGRNRDTAWFSMLDREWPAVGAGLDRWLDAGNFDDAGRQRSRLAGCRPSPGPSTADGGP